MPIKTRYVETHYDLCGKEIKECQTWNEVKEYAKEILNPGQSLLAWIKDSHEGETRRWICSPQHKVIEVKNW